MKKTTFAYTLVLGKLDHVPCIVDVEISEDEYRRIKESFDSGNYMSMEEDFSLEDITDKVYEASLAFDASVYPDLQDELIQLIMDSKDVDDDEAEEIAESISMDEIKEMLDDLYPRIIGYPTEFSDDEE